MPSDRLTELGIRKSTCGPKQKKMTDGKGLFLLLHPNGSKYWRMKYQFSGKEKTLAAAKRGDRNAQVAWARAAQEGGLKDMV